MKFFFFFILIVQTTLANAFNFSPICTKSMHEGLQRFDNKITFEQWGKFIKGDQFNKCPLTKKFLQYVFYQHPKQQHYSPYEIIDFIQKNPHWPGKTTLKAKIEEKITFSPEYAMKIVQWFDDNSPTKGTAIWAYTQALSYLGQKYKLKKMVKKLWVEGQFDKSTDYLFYKTYRKILSPQDNHQRVDNLLWKKTYGSAKIMIPRLSDSYKLLTQSRLLLQQLKPGVDWHVKKAHPQFKDHLGFIYDRLVWRREKKKNTEALSLFKDKIVPSHRKKAFWHERHILTRRALEKKDYARAFSIIKDHGLQRGANFAMAEWLAGFIALRFLNKPREAERRFLNLFNKVKGPISRSRAAYWLGKTYDILNNTKKADKFFSIAANYRTTFYGQLAACSIGIGSEHYKFKKTQISSLVKNTVELRQFAKLLVLLSHSPKAYDWTRFFAINLAKRSKTRDEEIYTIQFITKWAPSFAVEAARTLSRKKEVYIPEAYPAKIEITRRDPKDKSLIFSIIRRESMFAYKAISHAGAMGLMQMRPFMAKNIAKKHKIKLRNVNEIIVNPKLNIILGSAFLQDLLIMFNHSYPLAIAAYNAGEGVVKKWLKIYGDPSKGEIDWIDWMEQIPYFETRNYVQRVLEQIYIYRTNYDMGSKEHPLITYYQARPLSKKNTLKN